MVLTRVQGAGAADTGADEITEGWLIFLHQLKFLHEKHPGTSVVRSFLRSRRPRRAPRLLHTVPAEVGPPGTAPGTSKASSSPISDPAC